VCVCVCVCVCVHTVSCIIYGQKLLKLEALLEVVLILHFSKITKIKASIFLINVYNFYCEEQVNLLLYFDCLRKSMFFYYSREKILERKSSNRRYRAICLKAYI